MANLNNVHRYISAGFRRLDGHVLDANGLPAGATGVCVAGATGCPAWRITAVKTMNVNTPASTNVPVEGDNILQGTFQFPSNAARAFDIAFSEDDFDDRQPFQGILPYNVGNHAFAGRDISPYFINTCTLIGVSDAKAQASGIQGLPMYGGVIIPRAQIAARGRSTFAGRTAAQFDASVTMNLADAYPWAETFQASKQGFTGSYVEDWTFVYPVTLHRHLGDAATKTFNLAEKPSSSSLSDVLIFLLDANNIPTRQLSGVTVDPTGQTITFVSAPTAVQNIVTYYGYIPTN